MTKEEAYIKHKKKNIIRLVNKYNKRASHDNSFQINENNLDLENTFCNPKRCKGCGECCQKFSCVFSPGDFLNITDLDYMRNILNSGIVCISSTSHGTLILRPRRKKDDKQIVSITTDSYSCLLHSSHGCLLPAAYRPSEGLLYYPSKYGHIVMYEDEQTEDEYAEYQNILWELFHEYNDQVIPIDIIEDESGFVHCTEEDARSLAKRLAGY